MLWSAAITIFIIIENESPAGRHAVGNWLPLSLFTFCFVTTWLNVFSDGDLQFYLFHFTFGACVRVCVHACVRACTRGGEERRSSKCCAAFVFPGMLGARDCADFQP